MCRQKKKGKREDRKDKDSKREEKEEKKGNECHAVRKCDETFASANRK